MKGSKGFTLVEIILSIAIIGILAISLLPLFTFAFKTVFAAGHKSEEIFLDQQNMEKSIADHEATNADNLSISFPGSYTITVDGQEMTNGEFKLFIPER